jgi:hypothetical protein
MTVRDALLLSTIAFLVLAALTLAAGVIVVFLSRANDRAKDRQLADYQSAGETRVHSVRANAAAALERLLAREAENLKTMERMAVLVREAAALNAQTLANRVPAVDAGPAVPRIAQQSADGALSADQRGKMVSVLIRRPGDVTVINSVGIEAERHAAEIRAIFRASGWRVASGGFIEPRVPGASLSLVLGTSEQDVAVREAFAAAGVAVTDRPRSPTDRPTTVYVG